jgi:nicotinamidase-related amidase
MGYRRSNESEEDDLSHTESEENTEKKKENLSKEKTMKSRQSSKIIASLFALLTLLAVGAFVIQTVSAQQKAPMAAKADPGSVLLDPSDTLLLLLDHQTGLFQTVKDISVAELRTNTVILIKAAKLMKVPIITTASVPDGPNGPLMEEINQYAPDAIYVPRKGEISAWDNEDFLKTVRETGRKTLVIAGVWTSVCVAFPALQALADGYNVYAVMDASGDPSEMASRTTLARLTQAGVVPVSTNVVLCELQRTWNRPDAADFAQLYAAYSPNYRAVMESYNKAQEVLKQEKK